MADSQRLSRRWEQPLMTALTFVRELFHFGRGAWVTTRASSKSKRSARYVAIESLELATPRTAESDREQMRKGFVAEMSARQAGL